MVSQVIVLKNKVGLHARPAAQLVQTAQKYQASILISKGEKTANAKSILSILQLVAKLGDEIQIIAEGADEEMALNELVNLLKNELGD